MKTAIVLRTNRLDPRTLDRFEALRQTGLELLVAADERHGTLDTGSLPKVSLTEASVSALGLRPHPDMGWLCGDYFTYLASAALPGVEHFWLLEPDIRVHFARPLDFFAAFMDSDADIVSPRFDLAPAHWYWTKRVAPYRSPVYRMLFGAIRISRRAIGLAFAARRALPAIPDALWPNDEALVATTAANSGLACRTLAEFGRFMTPASFSFFRPLSGLAHDQVPFDGLLYHPVLYGEDFLRKAEAYCRRFPTEANIAAMHDGLVVELGAATADGFATRMRQHLPA